MMEGGFPVMRSPMVPQLLMEKSDISSTAPVSKGLERRKTEVNGFVLSSM